MKISAKFPAGTYYIGDLCYVMHNEWVEVCNITIQDNALLEGAFNLSDGRRFFFGTTAYGDGEYPDNQGNLYGVDAGSIGIIAVKDISETDKENLELGSIHTFNEGIIVSTDNGYFQFGNVIIDTAYESENEDEDEEWDD
jgi:hypothetical protein